MRGVLSLLRLLRTQWDTPAHLRRRQDAGLVRLVRHAYAHVPFYRQRFDAAGVTPRDIRGMEDLSRIPETTKQELQQAPRAHTVAAGADLSRCRRVWTSGATGVPLETALSRSDASEMNASFLRVQRAWGARPWDRLASLDFRPDVLRQRSWYESFGLFRKRRLSSAATASHWLEVLAAWRLQGYSVTLQMLADAVAASGRTDVNIPLVVSTSGTLHAHGRASIASALHATVIDVYASVEAGGVIAWECPVCGGYHVDADRLLVEFVRDGRPAAPGEEADVLLTNLGNYTTPFIRYRHGDIVVPSAAVPRCGRALPLIGAVLGRDLDCLVLPSGGRVNPHAIWLAMDACLGVGEWRVTQTQPDVVVVEFSARGTDVGETTAGIVRGMRPLVGEHVTIETRRMEKVPPDPRRKLRPIMSLIRAPGSSLAHCP